jgi:hypothetical protein
MSAPPLCVVPPYRPLPLSLIVSGLFTLLSYLADLECRLALSESAEWVSTTCCIYMHSLAAHLLSLVRYGAACTIACAVIVR